MVVKNSEAGFITFKGRTGSFELTMYRNSVVLLEK